jgi:fermentation-respiration switch protein FrsA (DUF1100 family)
MRRGWTIALGGALLVALGIWFGMTALVRGQIFHPHNHPIEAPVWTGAPARSITTSTADGLVLQGYYWAPEGANDLVVVFHGNGSSQQRMADAVQPLTADGHGVLVASYRGYGGNPGSPSEAGLFLDGDAWIAKARALLPAGGRLYIFGHSPGGGVALEMAARHPVDGVATLGTFTSIADMAPWIARPFILDRFDNLSAIRRIKAPITLFHGDMDATVPYSCAPRLAAAADGRARLIRLAGVDHTLPYSRFGPMLWAALQGNRLGRH